MTTPNDRLLNVLKRLDEDLDVLGKDEKSDITKITATLRWITGNLNKAAVVEFIDANEYALNNAEAIKNLLDESLFDVTQSN